MNQQLVSVTTRIVSPGNYYPLGASLTPEGVNFAVYSQNASQVFLLLFDSQDDPPTGVIELKERTKLDRKSVV